MTRLQQTVPIVEIDVLLVQLTAQHQELQHLLLILALSFVTFKILKLEDQYKGYLGLT